MDREFLKVKTLAEGHEVLIRVSEINYIREVMSECVFKADGRTYVVKMTMEQLIELLNLKVFEG